MHDIAAALGIVQLKNLDRMNECRRQLAARYTRAFQGTGWIRTPVEKTGVRSSCHNYVIRVDRDRNALIAHLKSRGIAAGVHYMPLYLHSAFRKRGIRGTCPVADRVWQTLVTLPLYPTLSEEEQDRVIRAVSEFGG
jgi:dTDP-4-amino-4,6-dideoxygalactose transaminase